MDTGTCTTANAQKPFDMVDLLTAAVMIRKVPPEPIGEWMRLQGYPPEQWTLVIPEKMFDSEMSFLPSYVRRSPTLDKPAFLFTGFIGGN